MTEIEAVEKSIRLWTSLAKTGLEKIDFSIEDILNDCYLCEFVPWRSREPLP